MKTLHQMNIKLNDYFVLLIRYQVLQFLIAILNCSDNKLLGETQPSITTNLMRDRLIK